MAKAITSVHLIGAMPVGASQRKGYQASLAAEHSAVRRVSAWPNASNAWNQNWNSSNPGNQNNNSMAAMLRSHGHIVALQANRMFTERIPL